MQSVAHRMGRWSGWPAATFAALVLAGCGADGGGSATAADTAASSDTASTSDIAADDSATTGDASAADALVDPFAGAPARLCRAGGGWDGKTPLFSAWSEALGQSGDDRAKGIRISAADLDGDGLPEVLVRRNVIGQRSDPSDPKTRHFTLLRNVAGPDGTRKLVDATVASGVLTTRDGKVGRPCHVAIFGDVDDDGDTDIFCGMHVTADKPGEADGSTPLDHSEWLRNDGKGQFSLGGDASPWQGEARRALTSATFVDYNRDGLLDLWLGYGTWGNASTADLLFAGDGKGGFVDVSAGEGLATLPPTLSALQSGAAHRNTWGTGACDFNGDGHPDLYTTSYGRYFNGLWMGGGLAGGSRFADLMGQSRWDRDLDDDWTTNWNAQCYCQENPKAADCDKAKAPVVNCASLKQAFGGSYRWNHATDRDPWRLGGTTGGAVCADLDEDGDLDAAQWNIVHSDVGPSSDATHILLNDGGKIPLFDHPTPKTSGLQRDWGGLSWNEGDISGAVADFDLDGHLDLLVAGSDYPGTRAVLWLGKGDGTFTEVPFALAIDHRRAAGLAVVDLDGDGDLDVIVGSSRARCSGASGADCPPDERVEFWRNETIHDGGGTGNAVVLQLVGGGDGEARSNRSAIGARVEVVAGGKTRIAELQGGYGHFGQQNGLLLHVGIGAACDVDEVRVHWPDLAGTVETFKGVRANYRVRLVRGAGLAAYP